MNEQIKKPVTSIARDLGWSQVRETSRMLFLAVAQIEMAIKESDDSVSHLTDAFSSMMGYENSIKKAVDQLPNNPETKAVHDTIAENIEHINAEMQRAIVAFQFYDKLTQRLFHVSQSVESLSELVSDTGRVNNPDEWTTLQQKIKQKYSMREELEMFDSVMSGADVREAIRVFNEAQKTVEQDSIEFF